MRNLVDKYMFQASNDFLLMVQNKGYLVRWPRSPIGLEKIRHLFTDLIVPSAVFKNKLILKHPFWWVYLRCLCCLHYCYLLLAAFLPVLCCSDLSRNFQMTSLLRRFFHYDAELISGGLDFLLSYKKFQSLILLLFPVFLYNLAHLFSKS